MRGNDITTGAHIYIILKVRVISLPLSLSLSPSPSLPLYLPLSLSLFPPFLSLSLSPSIPPYFSLPGVYMRMGTTGESSLPYTMNLISFSLFLKYLQSRASTSTWLSNCRHSTARAISELVLPTVLQELCYPFLPCTKNLKC